MGIHNINPINPFCSLRKESRLKMVRKTVKEYIFNILITVVCFNMSHTEFYNSNVS
jgi:hypothetical protein